MPRVLVCIDPQPATDGSCQQTEWIEQASVADMLPTIDDAQMVGSWFFASIVLLAAMVLLLPPKETES